MHENRKKIGHSAYAALPEEDFAAARGRPTAVTVGRFWTVSAPKCVFWGAFLQWSMAQLQVQPSQDIRQHTPHGACSATRIGVRCGRRVRGRWTVSWTFQRCCMQQALATGRRTDMMSLQMWPARAGRRRRRRQRREDDPCKQTCSTALTATLRPQTAMPVVVDQACAPQTVLMAPMAPLT